MSEVTESIKKHYTPTMKEWKDPMDYKAEPEKEKYIFISEKEYIELMNRSPIKAKDILTLNERLRAALEDIEEINKLRHELSCENTELREKLEKRNKDFMDLAEKVRAYVNQEEK